MPEQVPTRKILLVDDELSVRTMLQAVLESENYQVETAESGAAAKEKLSAHDFGVVITDMRMETVAAGFDVARAARKAYPDIGIIILTAFPVDQREWEEAGADACLTKPVPITDLLQTVHELLQRRDGPQG